MKAYASSYTHMHTHMHTHTHTHTHMHARTHNTHTAHMMSTRFTVSQLNFAANGNATADKAISLDLPERGIEHSQDHCHVPPCPRFWFPGP